MDPVPEPATFEPVPAPRKPAPAPEAAPKKRGRKPLDAQGRARSAERAAVRRLLKKVEDSGTAEELMERLEQARRGAETPPPVAPADAAPPAVAGEPVVVLEPGQQPGWPPPSVVAQFQPLALMLWSGIATVLEPTRYALKPKTIEVDGTELRVEPVTQLASATAPVMAKYLSVAATSPEAGLLLAIGLCFAPAMLDHAKTLVSEMVASKPAQPPPSELRAV